MGRFRAVVLLWLALIFGGMAAAYFAGRALEKDPPCDPAQSEQACPPAAGPDDAGR